MKLSSGTLSTVVESKRLSRFASSPAVAVDAAGARHVVYVNTWSRKVIYATDRGGAWAWYTLDNASVELTQPVITVDADGAAHVAYIVPGDSAIMLRYATNASGDWQVATVEVGLLYPLRPAIRVSAMGVPTIVFCDLLRLMVVRANWSGRGWSTTGVGRIMGIVWALGVDDADHVFAYTNVMNQAHMSYEVVAATDASGTWVSEVLDETPKFPAGGTMTVRADGHAGIGYGGTLGQVFAVFDGQQWARHVNREHYAGSYSAMTWDGDQLLSLQTYRNDLLLWSFDGEEFVAESVDQGYISGGAPGLRVDTQGRLHTICGLSETERVAGYFVGDGQTWQAREFPTPEGSFPTTRTLVLDAADYLHYLYLDTEIYDIHHAYQTSAGWFEEWVTAENWGKSTDLTLARDGTLWAAAQRRDQVEILYRDQGDWIAQGFGPVSYNSNVRLAVGLADTVLLSIVGFKEISLATVNRDGWEWESLRVGYFRESHGMAATSAGAVYLVVADIDSATFIVGHNDLGDWEWSDTGLDAYAGLVGSVVVAEESGNVYFSYFGVGEDLRVATNRSGEWVSEVVDYPGAVGRDSMLQFTPDGLLHVVYSSADALWTATLDPESGL